ncbi:UDPglucose 6-dehydrogenase [Clostridium cavendishii DSM 21758]|uniref:UDP-glucose 6-dehydrogenase n=1 Tax=Clostridium cavendishii DSM 21758 TaxID=1121302 RepID=A0A1M6IYJ0_9CLOT|nr:nucleotide sugar dehydrogenase [Clostridium cavendishii]SHJ39437.1 UDPglucose 6-dehydrogenase [Clostridium cavendishii DSM 21758]
MINKITVMGLGFVGLTTALGFSEKGYKVYGYDINCEKVEKIKNGILPFYEKSMEEILKKNINNNFLLVDSLKEAVENSKFIFFCVGTPCGEGGKAELTYLINAIKETLKYVKKGQYKILIIKSTVPPSTTKNRVKPFIEECGFIVGEDVGLANNPEFLREGCAWDDFINPDRIVIGQSDENTGRYIEEIYKCFNAPIYKVSLNTGEFVKYLSNTLLSTMISFSNEMSMIACEVGDINIKEAFKLLHIDKRWFGEPAKMSTYVYPGCGFGGYCLPKDTQAIYSLSKGNGFEAKILRSVLDVNNDIKYYLVNKVLKEVKSSEYIGILGLSFKPNSDDIRETPAKFFIEELIKRGHYNIIAYDPLAIDNFKKSYDLPIKYAKDLEEIMNKAENIIILTAWNEFKNISNIEDKKIFDLRYML